MKQTFTGTPVQVMKWNGSMGNWQILPGIISSVNKTDVSIIIIGDKKNTTLVNPRHANFKKVGFDYWDFIPKTKGGQYINVIYP